MLTNIRKLPGNNCIHYVCGHCVYWEVLNPGYHCEWKCAVLSSLLESYDHLLRQADKFDLNRDQIKQIWKNRLTDGLPLWNCPQYMPDKGNDDECIYLLHTHCILKMPVCSGRCRFFVFAGKMGVNSQG
ncbi:MAG: hypothetical protein R6V39_11080 [Desulfovibrionales bacterium]